MKNEIINLILEREKEGKNIDDTADAIIEVFLSEVAMIDLEQEVKRLTLSTYQASLFADGFTFLKDEIKDLA